MTSFLKRFMVGYVQKLVELRIIFKVTFFVTVGFVYSRWRSTVTDGVCRQIHLTRHFSHAHCTRLMMCNHTSWLKCLHE